MCLVNVQALTLVNNQPDEPPIDVTATQETENDPGEPAD